MKNEIQQTVFFNKQVAVHVESQLAPLFEISPVGDTCHLRIIQPDGTERVFLLSARCKGLGLIKALIGDEEIEGEEPNHEISLPVPFKLDLEGNTLLSRYLCDAEDPVDRFPALTHRELHQFARIETHIGGDHSKFWESYGFSDGHNALMAMNDDVAMSHEKRQKIDGTALETKSADELRELRFYVDSKLRLLASCIL